MKFAKLFNIDGEQVLIYMEPDDDGDYSEEDHRIKINQIVDLDGIYMNIALRGFKAENAEKAFDFLDENAAKNVLKIAHSFIDEALNEDNKEREREKQ